MNPAVRRKQNAAIKKESNTSAATTPVTPATPSTSIAAAAAAAASAITSVAATPVSAATAEAKQVAVGKKPAVKRKAGQVKTEGKAKGPEEKTNNTQQSSVISEPTTTLVKQEASTKAAEPTTTLVKQASSEKVGEAKTNKKKKTLQAKTAGNGQVNKTETVSPKKRKASEQEETVPTTADPLAPTSSSSSSSSGVSSLSNSTSYNLGDLSALFCPSLEKDVFAGALSVPTPASSSATSAATAPLGKHARKKLKKKGLPAVVPPVQEEKSPETKAEEGIVLNTEKIQQSLERQRQFAKGADHHEDDERLPRTIFVGNVPVNLPIKKLIKEFKQYGEVESARYRSFGQGDPKLSKRAAFATKSFHEDRDSCNAYVVFKDEESAKKALAHNSKTIDGRIVRVDMAGGTKKGDKNRSIFVGNLPLTVKENELRDFFSDSGSVENVRVVRDKMSGAGKGFAFVLFHDVASARKALAHDQSKFAERPLRVFKAVDKPKPLKKAATSKPAGSAGKQRTFRKTKEGAGAESWQGQTARVTSSASLAKKRKHAIRGKGFIKKTAGGEVKTTTKKVGNSAKKFRKENDKKHIKKPVDS